MTGSIEFKPTDPTWFPRILDVDNVVATTSAQGKNVALRDKNVVDSPGELVGEFRQDRYSFPRAADTKHDKAVSPIRGTFTTNDCNITVFGHLHVVHRSRIDLHLLNLFDVRRIADVPNVGMPICPPRTGNRVVAVIGPLQNPQIRRPAVDNLATTDYLNLAPYVATFDRDSPSRRMTPSSRDYCVGARTLGNEPSVFSNLCRCTSRDDGASGLAADRELDGDPTYR